MFSVRLVSADSYQAQPLPQLDPAFSEFRGSEIKHVPVLRIFGSTPTGEKTCLHVHGVFPYMYVPYTGEEDPGSLSYRLAASLDAAINVSLGSATSNAQHVYSIQRVSGIPFYGYHKKEHQYLKIYFYNPGMVKRAADLLQNGSVLNQSLQPHEAHIPYILQFMMDYNVYGMSMINLSGVKHRRQPPSLAELASSGVSENAENIEIDYLPNSVERQSTCHLEIDALASDILNRRQIESGLDLNPGLAAIWDEERARRAQAGFSGGDSQLVNPKSPPRPTFQPTENDNYQEQRLARRLLMISQCDESTLSATTNQSVAYAAEVRDGENLSNSSNISVPVIQRSQFLPREDTIGNMTFLDSPTIAARQKFSADCSVLGMDDMPLVDLLVELAGGDSVENSESVDTDSVLGSQVSLLLNEDKSDNEAEDIDDLNLTCLQLDSLSGHENAQNRGEYVAVRNEYENSLQDKKSSLSTVHPSSFLTPLEAALSSSRSGNEDEGDVRKTKDTRKHRMPQYDGAGDVSPTLVNSSSSSDEDSAEDNDKNAKEFSHLPKYNGTCEIASNSRKSDCREQASKLSCRANNGFVTTNPTDHPLTCDWEKSIAERSSSPYERCIIEDTTETGASTVCTSLPSVLTNDAYLGQYSAINYEPFDRLAEIGPDFIPDLEGMHSSMEIGILLSSGDSDPPESVVQDADNDIAIPLDAVLNGDPCFTESAELDKSDVTELRDQYASLLGNSLLPDVHMNPPIDDDLGSPSNYSDSDYQGNERNYRISINVTSSRSTTASRDSSSSSENVTPNIQEPESRSGSRSKLNTIDIEEDCKQMTRGPSDNSDYNCNLVATWAELQNIREDKRLYRLRNRRTGQWIPGPRQSRRKADKKSLPNITSQLFGRVPDDMQIQFAAENLNRNPRTGPLGNASKIPVKKTKSITTPSNLAAPIVTVESTIATVKKAPNLLVVELAEEKLSTSPLPNVSRITEAARQENDEETTCQPLHTEASLAAFHRSIIGSDNPLAETKQTSPERLYSSEPFRDTEILVEPAIPAFEELTDNQSEGSEPASSNIEFLQGTSYYSSQRSDKDYSDRPIEHRHCTWSVGQKKIVQDQVFTADEIYIIEKRKRGKHLPPDRSICTRGDCKLPVVLLKKIDSKKDYKIDEVAEARSNIEAPSCDLLPSQCSADFSKIVVVTEESPSNEISVADTNAKDIESTNISNCLPKRKPRGRRKLPETPIIDADSSTNDNSSIASMISSSDDKPKDLESSDWAENEGRTIVRRIPSDDETRDPYNMRKMKNFPTRTKKHRLQTKESKISVNAPKRCSDFPGIPGIVEGPKKRGRPKKIISSRCKRSSDERTKIELTKSKKPLGSLLFPNWGAQSKISVSPPNGMAKAISNGLTVHNHTPSVPSDKRKGRTLKTGYPSNLQLPKRNEISRVNVNDVSPSLINHSSRSTGPNDKKIYATSSPKQMPEDEALDSMIREVKCPSTLAKLKLLRNARQMSKANCCKVESGASEQRSRSVSDEITCKTKVDSPISPKDCFVATISAIPTIPQINVSAVSAISRSAKKMEHLNGERELVVGGRRDEKEIEGVREYERISLGTVADLDDPSRNKSCPPVTVNPVAISAEEFIISVANHNKNCDAVCANPVDALTGEFDSTALSIVFDTSVDDGTSPDIFETDSEITESLIVETDNSEESSNETKQISYRSDRYAINDENFFATNNNYTIDAVSLEIPTCLFEEDSNSVEQQQRSSKRTIDDRNLQNLEDFCPNVDDNASSISMDPRDLDVYDVESLTSSSTLSQLADVDATEYSLIPLELSRPIVIENSTNSEYTMANNYSCSGKTREGQVPPTVTKFKETDDFRSEEDSPEFEAPSPSPKICEILNNSLEKQFNVNREVEIIDNREKFDANSTTRDKSSRDKSQTAQRCVDAEEDNTKLDEEIKDLVSHIVVQFDNEPELPEASDSVVQSVSTIEVEDKLSSDAERCEAFASATASEANGHIDISKEKDDTCEKREKDNVFASIENGREAVASAKNEREEHTNISIENQITSSEEMENEVPASAEKDQKILTMTAADIEPRTIGKRNKELGTTNNENELPIVSGEDIGLQSAAATSESKQLFISQKNNELQVTDTSEMELPIVTEEDVEADSAVTAESVQRVIFQKTDEFQVTDAIDTEPPIMDEEGGEPESAGTIESAQPIIAQKNDEFQVSDVNDTQLSIMHEGDVQQESDAAESVIARNEELRITGISDKELLPIETEEDLKLQSIATTETVMSIIVEKNDDAADSIETQLPTASMDDAEPLLITTSETEPPLISAEKDNVVDTVTVSEEEDAQPRLITTSEKIQSITSDVHINPQSITIGETTEAIAAPKNEEFIATVGSEKELTVTAQTEEPSKYATTDAIIETVAKQDVTELQLATEHSEIRETESAHEISESNNAYQNEFAEMCTSDELHRTEKIAQADGNMNDAGGADAETEQQVSKNEAILSNISKETPNIMTNEDGVSIKYQMTREGGKSESLRTSVHDDECSKQMKKSEVVEKISEEAMPSVQNSPRRITKAWKLPQRSQPTRKCVEKMKLVPKLTQKNSSRVAQDTQREFEDKIVSLLAQSSQENCEENSSQTNTLQESELLSQKNNEKDAQSKVFAEAGGKTSSESLQNEKIEQHFGESNTATEETAQSGEENGCSQVDWMLLGVETLSQILVTETAASSSVEYDQFVTTGEYSGQSSQLNVDDLHPESEFTESQNKNEREITNKTSPPSELLSQKTVDETVRVSAHRMKLHKEPHRRSTNAKPKRSKMLIKMPAVRALKKFTNVSRNRVPTKPENSTDKPCKEDTFSCREQTASMIASNAGVMAVKRSSENSERENANTMSTKYDSTLLEMDERNNTAMIISKSKRRGRFGKRSKEHVAKLDTEADSSGEKFDENIIVQRSSQESDLRAPKSLQMNIETKTRRNRSRKISEAEAQKLLPEETVEYTTTEHSYRGAESLTQQIVKDDTASTIARRFRSSRIAAEEKVDGIAESVAHEEALLSQETVDDNVGTKISVKPKRTARSGKTPKSDGQAPREDYPLSQDESFQDIVDNFTQKPDLSLQKVIDEKFQPIKLEDKSCSRKIPLVSSQVESSKSNTEKIAQCSELLLQESIAERTDEKISDSPNKRGRPRKNSVANNDTLSLHCAPSQDESIDQEIELKSLVKLKKVGRSRKNLTANESKASLGYPLSQEEIMNEAIQSKSLVELKRAGRRRKNRMANVENVCLVYPSSQDESMDEGIQPKSPVKLKRTGRPRKNRMAYADNSSLEYPSSQEDEGFDLTVRSLNRIKPKRRGRSRTRASLDVQKSYLESLPSQEELRTDVTEEASQISGLLSQGIVTEDMEPKPSEKSKRRGRKKIPAANLPVPFLEASLSHKQNDRNITENVPQELEVSLPKFIAEVIEPKTPPKLEKKTHRRKSAVVQIQTQSLKIPSSLEESDRKIVENAVQESKSLPSELTRQNIVDENIEPKSPVKYERKCRLRKSQVVNNRKSSPIASSREECNQEIIVKKSSGPVESPETSANGNIQTKTLRTPKKRVYFSKSLDANVQESSPSDSTAEEIVPEITQSALESTTRSSQNPIEKSSVVNAPPVVERLSLENTKTNIERKTFFKLKKRVRFDEEFIRRSVASLRPVELTPEEKIEEPSPKKHYTLSLKPKQARSPTEVIILARDDNKISNDASEIGDADFSDATSITVSLDSTSIRDQNGNAPNSSDIPTADETNGVKEHEKLKLNNINNTPLDLSSLQIPSGQLLQFHCAPSPNMREIIYRDENLSVTNLNWIAPINTSLTEQMEHLEKFNQCPVDPPRWKWTQATSCVQLRKPKVILKRLSRDSLKVYGITFRPKNKRFVKNLKKSSAIDDFRVPAYDGAADLTSSDSEDEDPDVTVAREEKRVCVYQSGKKSPATKRESIFTPKKRKLDDEETGIAGPSCKRRTLVTTLAETTPKRSPYRSPSRTSMLKSPGRLSGYYPPLPIIVTSPKVRKETSEPRANVGLENHDAKVSSSSCVTPRRKDQRLRENMMRGRISATKSSRSELVSGEKHDLATTMGSERYDELDEIVSSTHKERRPVDDVVPSTMSTDRTEPTRIRDTTAIPKDSKDVRKKLVFSTTGDNKPLETSSDSAAEQNKESKILNISGERSGDFATINDTRESIEISEIPANPKSTLSVSEPGPSHFDRVSNSMNRDPYNVTTDEDGENDDDACNVTFSQYVDSQINKNQTLLDRSQIISTDLNDGRIVVRPKFNPPNRRNVVETMETYGIAKHRNQDAFFSVEADVPKHKELAHKILKVPGKGLKDMPSFVSSVEGVTGIARWRKMKINEFNPSLARSKDVDIKIALGGNERVVLTPLVQPPTRKDVKDWLRAREYLAKKKKQEQEEAAEKTDNDECNSKALDLSVPEPSSEIIDGKGESEKSIRTLKIKLAKKGSFKEVDDFTLSKLRHGSEEERKIELQIAAGSSDTRRGSGDSNSTDIDPSLLSVLGKSRLFREQEASRHLGVSCGQIDFLSASTRSNVANENLQNAKALTRYQYLTIMCLEVHVTTRGDLLPDAQYDPIAAIFYSVQSDVPPTSTMKPLEHGVIVLADTEKAKNRMHYAYASNAPWSISIANNEEALLNSLVNLITRVDPEILIGWELETLSWGYVFQRAANLGMNLYKRISRIPTTQGKWEAQPRDIETLAEVKLPGRIVLDIWRLMRHEAALLSYTFESVTHHVLNERISCPSFKALTDWWNLQSSRSSRWRVIEHYGIRVLGVFRILDQLDIIGRTSELARLFGIQFFEVFSRGSQYRVESVMLRLAKPLNYIAVSPSPQQRASMRAMEALPLIMEPESKFYSDPLIVLDFQSLYPSIIIAHNYCFSTCLGRIEHIGQPQPFEFGAYTLRVPKSTSLKLQGKVNFAPCGVAFVKPEVRLGILPRMLTEILETRFMVKKAMKDHKRDDKTLQRALHSRQMGLKFLANVTYGYTAANFSGRMPCIEVGDSVISKSKETLERAIKLVETTPKWGARVVYGDTDSLFILVPGRSKADAFVIGNEIADAVTASNPPPIKLKFEKVLYPAILQTKKRYCGYMYETPEQEQPTYLAKGIETVRRDGCPAVSKILEKTLKILFETKDVSLVKKYVTRQLDKVLRGKVSIQDLTFAKEFRGLKGYKAKACVPALELTKRLMKKDPRAVPRNNERVRYVIVAGAPNQALIHCVRTPWELINDPGLRPNAIYYVTRVIIPPLNRCLNLMGVDVNAWYREMPHRHILDNPVCQPGDRQKLTIFQYFGTIVCAACGQSSNKGVCTECITNPADTLVIIQEKVRRLDRNDSHVTEICQSCVGRADIAACASLDCPVFYRRAQTQRELTQTIHLRSIIECGNNLEL